MAAGHPLPAEREDVLTTLSTGVRRVLGRDASTHDVLVERMVESVEDGEPVPVTAEEGRETVRVVKEISAQLT